ncbi:KAT8 regulatory NSL complex subunit 3 [Trichinella papuae]|uniref:KAT8 regulatory NSL complex subunit 3 n=1 Tax=Trichinella papuae TaxID=268474 RepID=A0A0V1M7R7_9BILA|nr:KAT8 regulatory NSL complex subunit 3 [Trichinella papuae]
MFEKLYQCYSAMAEASNANEILRLSEELPTGTPNADNLITLYEALQRNSRKTRNGAYYLYSQAEENDTDEFPHIYYQSVPKQPKYSEPHIQRLFHYQPWPTAALPPNISPTERIEGRYFTGVPDNTVEDIGLDYTWRWATKSAKDIRRICAGENYNDLPLCPVWEELVLRDSSENEASYVQSISNVIKKFMLFKLSTKMVYNEHLLVSEKLKKSAHQLLDLWSSMYLFKVDVRKVHRLFLTSLPEPYLICYLCLLKSMKQERSELVRKVVLPKDNVNSIDSCLSQLMGIKSINRTKVNFPFKIPQSFRMDVLMVLFWPTVKFTGEQGIYSYDNCKYFFECLLPGYCKCIDIKCPSIKEERLAKKLLDEYMASMQSKFYSIAKQLQDKKVILVGWHLSCEVVIELLESSSAWGAILFGFTNKCDSNAHGIVYPRLLKVEQPVLFIVGERARQCDIHDLSAMLNTMKHPKTKAIVIGHANDQLHMDSTALFELHINQMIVNHCILERVLDYIHSILIRESHSLNEVREFTSGGRPIRRPQKHFEQEVWFTKETTSAGTSFSQTTAPDRREHDCPEPSAQPAVEHRASDVQMTSNKKFGNFEEEEDSFASNNLPFHTNQAEHKGKIKMLIRRVGDDCYVIQSTPPAESEPDSSCLQSPSVEAVSDEVEDEQMQCKFSKMLTKLINFQSVAENGDAHDAVYDKRRGSQSPASVSNSSNRSPSQNMMEYKDSAGNKEMNKNPMQSNTDTILTLLNLLDYCIHNDVTMDDVRAKILEEVLKLLPGKDGVACNL